MNNVEMTSGKLYIDGRETRILSGAIHYFRIRPEQWRDRILKAKQMGLNTIETYFAHNLHEQQQGKFNFSGDLDIERFLEEIKAAGMYAIVRPGPYICAEWDNGGLPPWLMNIPGIEFRVMNRQFLAAVKCYLDQLLPRLKKYLYTNGGPIIMAQIENEYGSFACDHNYMEEVRKIFLNNGIDVPLFTADGPGDGSIQGGTIPGVWQTLNFGSNAKTAFAKGLEYRPDDHLFCMEFWNGWFDHWGEQHHTRTPEDAAAALDEILSCGGSVNFYMFCGGTNFGFMAGANGLGEKPNDYAPTVTSYDYDSPLSECGDPTPKYFAFQQVIKKHFTEAFTGTPEPSPKQSFGKIKLTQSAKLFDELDNLATPSESIFPPTMEECGQNYGFIHYRTTISGPRDEFLYFPEVRDRVCAYLDGKYLGTVFRNDQDRKINFSLKEKREATLDLLVENTGRINYGPQTGRDVKGLPKGVCSCWQKLCGFKTWNLELTNLNDIKFKPLKMEDNQPSFYRGTFYAETLADTFLRFPGVKGVVWINGFNIGRYWNIGPGNTLYIPWPLLKKGENEIIVFELHHLNSDDVEFCDTPELN